jgi:hypothetical protein
LRVSIAEQAEKDVRERWSWESEACRQDWLKIYRKLV